MRVKLMSSLLSLLLLPAMLFASGKISGTVTDKETKEVLVGANVAIEGTTLGAATDINGEYSILNVPVGVYSIRVTFVGYATQRVSNVRVSSDLTTSLDISVSSEAVTMEMVEIVAERPLINKDYTNTLTVKSSEEINNLPIRGISNVVGLQASVVQNEGNNLLYVRGGRATEVSYVVDGVPVNNPLSGVAGNSFSGINQNNVEELKIQTGGFNAEYGTAMSGVVNLNTRSAGARYTASAEFVTDAIAGSNKLGSEKSFGYNIGNLTVGGPIVPDNDVATLFLSAERRVLKDNDPRAVGGVKPNNEARTWNFSGNLSLKPVNELDIRIGGNYYGEKGNAWINSYRQFDPEHNPKFDNNTFSGYLRLTHTLGSNLFYTVQGSYFTDKTEVGDGVWFDNLLAYGDPALNPALAGVGINPSLVFSLAPPPGFVFNQYEKEKSRIITASGDVNLQAGDHLLKAGGEVRIHNIRRFNVNPLLLADPNTGAATGWTGYRNQNVEYYGYSFDGQSEYNGGDDFFGSRLEGPKKPIYISGYVQDKIELSDLVLNFGFRVDHFDAKEQVVKDPYNPFGPRTLPDGSNNPEGGVFGPEDLVASSAYTSVSPRLGFSFPITDRAIFHAQYGTFLQMPPLQYVLISKTWADRYMSGDAGFSTRIPNPNLRPERTVSYELGFKTLITDNASFSITGFYKDVKDLIQSRNVGTVSVPAYPSGYETFENVDFGTVKGFDIIFELRRTKNLAVVVNYTLGFANGTGSDPNTQSRLSWIQTANPKVVVPLDFDRRHVGSVNIDYRTTSEETSIFRRTGLSLLFTFNSGVPYTKSVITNPFFGGVTEVRPVGPINGATTPWSFRFDLKIDKGFSLGPVDLVAYLSVLNLLNAANVVGVDRVGGSGGVANPDGIDPAGSTPGVYRGTGLPDYSGWLQTLEGQAWIAANPTALVNGVTYTDPEQVFRNREVNPTNFGIPRQIRLGLRLEY
ncbi:MAG: TonB-dependent receptor [Ignavibacteria bacterium]|nr:TonB-dependent receptor [Ignavibacteria bacterium]